MKEYKILFLEFTDLYKSQFDINLHRIFTEILHGDKSLYEQALISHHADVTDQDLELGLFDNYQSPEWITKKQTSDIEIEIEEYILTQWSKNGSEFKLLDL